MSTRGRKRKIDPSIPGHIDQRALPAGVYWDRSGNGRWFVTDRDAEGRQKRQTIADSKVKLSDLHRLIEARAGVDRTSLSWLLGLFHESPQFNALAPRTRASYEEQRKIVGALKLKSGALGDLSVARLSQPFFQRLVDKVGADTPSKANHLLRYLSRVFSWGMNRGRCTHNPAKGVEQATERKQRRCPDDLAYNAVLNFARARQGYLHLVMELAYLCRLRGVEVITLSDANVQKDGLLTNRRKGSRDNLVAWTPRLRAAVDEATARRARIWNKAGMVVPFAPDQRALIVGDSGHALRKSSLDTTWQRMITAAMAPGGAIDEAQRFSLHDLKRKGITDTQGTRAAKQDASGHRTEAMLDIYDQSVPTVRPSKEG